MNKYFNKSDYVNFTNYTTILYKDIRLINNSSLVKLSKNDFLSLKEIFIKFSSNKFSINYYNLILNIVKFKYLDYYFINLLLELPSDIVKCINDYTYINLYKGSNNNYILKIYNLNKIDKYYLIFKLLNIDNCFLFFYNYEVYSLKK